MTLLRVVPAFAAGLMLAATACTTIIPPGGPPTVIRSTPFGSTVISPGGAMAGSGTAAPPANLDPDMPGTLPALAGGRDGIYSGLAVPLDTGGGVCITTQPIDRFQVSGDRVQWGLFRGRIRGAGLQMVNGNTWVFGQFDGNRFNGQITMYGRRQTPGCTFRLTLAKTGEL